LGFGVWGLGLRVEGWSSKMHGSTLQAAWFRVWGLGLEVQDLGFRVSGFGFRVSGLWLRVWGSGCTDRSQESQKSPRTKVGTPGKVCTWTVQGYLAHKKPPPP